MLSIRECLVRKSVAISKLYKEPLDNFGDENDIAVDIDSAEESQNFVPKKGIEIEQFFC